jgi:hypothetical protein
MSKLAFNKDKKSFELDRLVPLVGAIGNVVTVQPTKDKQIDGELMPHCSPLFAAKRLYQLTVLMEDVGKDYLQEEHESVFSATRVETEGEIHAFDKQIGTRNIVCDLAIGGNLCNFVHDFRKDPAEAKDEEIDEINCQFGQAKVNGYPRVAELDEKELSTISPLF